MKRTKGELLSNTENVKNSKFIDNNTLSLEYCSGIKAIRLHNTDVITFVDNTIVLNSGGWRTATTKDRINKYSPIRINQDRGKWYANSLLFFDGITFDNAGKCLSQPVKDNSAKENKMKARIKKFCAMVTEKNLPLPNSGDCWYCCLHTTEGKSMGELGNDKDHLLQHIKDGYLHGSLLVNAMRFKGYNDKQISIHYHMKIADTFRRTLRSYLYKKLLPEQVSR